MCVECVCVCVCVGVVARKRSYLPYIKKVLTSEAVADYFGHLLEDGSKVVRYVVYGVTIPVQSLSKLQI